MFSLALFIVQFIFWFLNSINLNWIVFYSVFYDVGLDFFIVRIYYIETSV